VVGIEPNTTPPTARVIEPQAAAASVLICDAEASILERLSRQLGVEAYRILSARSGKEALHRILADGPHIVIANRNLPDMNGLDLCRVIRAHEGTGSTYIIVTGSEDGDEHLREAVAAGADDYIAKPVRGPELRARLRSATRLIAARTELDQHLAAVNRLNAELAQAHEQLSQTTAIDELTSLANRREALARLQEYWAFASRHGTPLACMLLDLDNFRLINECHGQQVGDAVLRETARVLRVGARLEETAFRVGGEEFLVLCRNSTAEMAAVGAERIRQVVEQNVISVSELSLRVTVSAGVAERTSAHERPLDLLSAAGEALQTAKQGGRNRVSIHRPQAIISSDGPAQRRVDDDDASGWPSDVPISVGKVLVVDDDPAVRRFCRVHLEQNDYQVTEAGGSHDALAKISRDHPDVVVMDRHMPLMDGLECVRQIKAHPESGGIPVIVVSADYDRHSVRAALEAGAEEFLPKPLIAEEFLLRVKSMCRWRHSQRELAEAHAVHGEQARVLVELLDFSSAVAVAPTLETIGDLTINASISLFGTSAVTILVVEQDRRGLSVKRSTVIPPDRQPQMCIPLADRGTIAEVFRSGKAAMGNTYEDAAPRAYHGEQAIFGGMPWAAVPLTAQEQIMGVLVVGRRLEQRPLTPAELGFLEMICNSAGAAIREAMLSMGQAQAQNSIVLGLAKLAEHRDGNTGLHLERVSEFAGLLAKGLLATNRAGYAVDEKFVEDIERAIVLHDIGKVAVPDHILLKPGRLTPDEITIMRTHAKVGADTLRSVIGRVPGVSFLQMAEEIAYCHHEWYDGGGYPRGLKGTDIPLAARIAAAADVYDALTTKRPYKEAMEAPKAIAIIKQLSGSQFDPVIVETLLARRQEFLALTTALADGRVLNRARQATGGEFLPRVAIPQNLLARSMAQIEPRSTAFQ
jgi:diguanylate cyclase (GGDEF)-like protein